jgi:hypothetical protein
MFGLDLDKLQKDLNKELQKVVHLQNSIVALNLLIPELITQLKRLNDNLEKK